jgi:hypothetical protein
MDGDPNTFTAGELADIEAIWKLVVEDYAPFRVNVTTVDPGDFSNGKALRVAIGGNGAWYVFNPNATGVASINGFTDSGSNTAFVFSVKLRTAKNVGEISSHEAGHGFGLFHQSDFSTNPITEYYAGPGDGRAPIMGYPLDGIRSLWWYGPALTPSTPQDDMAVLSRSENGFGYRPDEAGENASTAASLTVSGNNVSGAGVITRTTDLDYWSFTTGAGFVSFTVSVPEGINNLDAKVALTNASGTLVTAWQDPTFGFGAAVSATLPAGSYRLVVGSHGGYGDVGQYTISGTRAGAGLQAALTSSGDSGAGQALTLEQLRLVVAQAIAYWAASVEPYHLGALSTLELHIADLPGSQLGLMFPDAIWIDVDAGGHGWSLDTDPTASARMDLLTVVVHELGHVLGLEHDDDAQGVMSAQLTPGERRLPAVDQSRTALGAPSMHGEADHGQTLPDVPFLPSVTRNIPNFLASVPGPRLDEKWNYPIETRRRSAATALVPPVESSDDVLDAGIRSWLDGDPWPNGAALDAVIDKAALRT